MPFAPAPVTRPTEDAPPDWFDPQGQPDPATQPASAQDPNSFMDLTHDSPTHSASSTPIPRADDSAVAATNPPDSRASSAPEPSRPISQTQPEPFLYLPVPELNRKDQFDNQVALFAKSIDPGLCQSLEVRYVLKNVTEKIFRTDEAHSGFLVPRLLNVLAYLHFRIGVTPDDCYLIGKALTASGVLSPLSAVRAQYAPYLKKHTHENHPALHITEFFHDPHDRSTLHLSVLGPAYGPLAVECIRLMCQVNKAHDDFEALGAEYVPDSLEHLRELHVAMRAPGLTFTQLADALFRDPLNQIHHDAPIPPRQSNARKALLSQLREHQTNLRLSLLAAKFEAPWDFDTVRASIPENAKPYVLSLLRQDLMPHPSLLLALLPPTLNRDRLMDTLKMSFTSVINGHHAACPPTLPVRVSLPLPKCDPRGPLGSSRSLTLLPTLPPPFEPVPLDDLPNRILVLDIECGTRQIGPRKFLNLPIHLALVTLEGQLVFSTGVQPPGSVTDTCQSITGISMAEYSTFPTYDHVYPFLYRFFSRGHYFVGHGIDNDFRALGVYLPASRVFDTSAFGVQALCAQKLENDGLPIPDSMLPPNTRSIALSRAIEILTGLPLRQPNEPHNPFVDCIASLGLFRKLAPDFLIAHAENLPALNARAVGSGFALETVRASYLPSDCLLSDTFLNRSVENEEMPKFSPQYHFRHYLDPRNLRHPKNWLPRLPSGECVQHAHAILAALESLPLTLADCHPEAYDEQFADFSRRVDTHGVPFTGPGSMATSPSFDFLEPFFPISPVVPDRNLPITTDPLLDASGVLLRHRRDWSNVTLADHELSIELDVALPVSDADWRAVWHPFY